MDTRPCVLAAAVGLAAGGCTTLFDDDFEADVAGGPPLTSPAGPPPADQLQFYPGFDPDGEGDVRVVASAHLGGAQHLEMAGPLEYGPMVVYANAAPGAVVGDPVHAWWSGSLSGKAAVYGVFHSEPDDANVIVYLDEGTVEVNGTPVGTYLPNAPHMIRITMFPESGTFTLSMDGYVGLSGTVSGPVVRDLQTPTGPLALWFSMDDQVDGDVYRLDDIAIRQ